MLAHLSSSRASSFASSMRPHSCTIQEKSPGRSEAGEGRNIDSSDYTHQVPLHMPPFDTTQAACASLHYQHPVKPTCLIARFDSPPAPVPVGTCPWPSPGHAPERPARHGPHTDRPTDTQQGAQIGLSCLAIEQDLKYRWKTFFSCQHAYHFTHSLAHALALAMPQMSPHR